MECLLKNRELTLGEQKNLINATIYTIKERFSFIKFTDFKYSETSKETKLIGLDENKTVVIDLTLGIYNGIVIGCLYDSVLPKINKQLLSKELYIEDINDILLSINTILKITMNKNKDTKEIINMENTVAIKRPEFLTTLILSEKEESNINNLVGLEDVRDIIHFISENSKNLILKNVSFVKHGILISDRMNIVSSKETNLKYSVAIDQLGYQNLSYVRFDKEKDLIVEGTKFDIYKNGTSIFISDKIITPLAKDWEDDIEKIKVLLMEKL